MMTLILAVLTFVGSAHVAFWSEETPVGSDGKEHLKLFTGNQLAGARFRLRNHKFKDRGLKDIIVDSRKKYSAVLFKVKQNDSNVLSIEILVTRHKETTVSSVKKVSSPNEDLNTLVEKLNLKR